MSKAKYERGPVIEDVRDVIQAILDGESLYLNNHDRPRGAAFYMHFSLAQLRQFTFRRAVRKEDE